MNTLIGCEPALGGLVLRSRRYRELSQVVQRQENLMQDLLSGNEREMLGEHVRSLAVRLREVAEGLKRRHSSYHEVSVRAEDICIELESLAGQLAQVPAKESDCAVDAAVRQQWLGVAGERVPTESRNRKANTVSNGSSGKTPT